jgi:hypothetical protein
MGPDPMSQGSAEGCLGPVCWSGLQLTRHAADKLETYGIDGARLESWRATLERGDPFLDRVVTTYPSDERTVTNRRRAGRWIYPAN